MWWCSNVLVYLCKNRYMYIEKKESERIVIYAPAHNSTAKHNYITAIPKSHKLLVRNPDSGTKPLDTETQGAGRAKNMRHCR